MVTHPMLFYTGLALVLLAAAQVASMAYWGWWRRNEIRGRQTKQKQHYVEQIATTLRAARAASTRLAAWQGTRELTVSAVVDEALGVRSLYLTAPDGEALPSFEPGQYLTLHLPIGKQGKPLVRCYSLSDAPRSQYYRISVKRCDAPEELPGVPPGLASNWLHDSCREGMTLQVGAPSGAFFLDPRFEEPVVLIGGGVGVTPLYSMLASMASASTTQQQAHRPAWLFYGTRNGSEHAFRDSLNELVLEHDHLQQFVAYSQPHDQDRPGIDFHHHGRLDAAVILDQLPPGKYRYYLCGPAGMMQSLVVGLLEAGVSDDHIHFEAFGPASVKRPSREAIDPVLVRFQNAGDESPWTGEFNSLLDLAESLGINVDFGCRAGNCGQCAVKIVDGHVQSARQPGVSLPDGECLMCISTPTSPVVLEA